ncbi:hypothetical protein PT974_05221 [Cladobotryum mycophilum]|uniref:Uncharacterized protein n=1 Tax=Cladobotryum mycophilum TaxID=491253 RepID=A0ABR0SJ91_9HYPO
MAIDENAICIAAQDHSTEFLWISHQLPPQAVAAILDFITVKLNKFTKWARHRPMRNITAMALPHCGAAQVYDYGVHAQLKTIRLGEIPRSDNEAFQQSITMNSLSSTPNWSSIPLVVNLNGDPLNFSGGSSLATTFLSVGIVLIVISTLTVTLRFYTNIQKAGVLSMDDWFCMDRNKKQGLVIMLLGTLILVTSVVGAAFRIILLINHTDPIWNSMRAAIAVFVDMFGTIVMDCAPSMYAWWLIIFPNSKLYALLRTRLPFLLNQLSAANSLPRSYHKGQHGQLPNASSSSQKLLNNDVHAGAIQVIQI